MHVHLAMVLSWGQTAITPVCHVLFGKLRCDSFGQQQVTFADHLISMPSVAVHEDVSGLDPHQPSHVSSRLHAPQLGASSGRPLASGQRLCTKLAQFCKCH